MLFSALSSNALFLSLQPSLPPASVYNEDYFADVASSPSLSTKRGKPKEREDKKKTKIKDREKRLSGSIRDLFAKDKDKDKEKEKAAAQQQEPVRRSSGSLLMRLSKSHDMDVTIAPAPAPAAAATPTSPANPVSPAAGTPSGPFKALSPRRTSPEGDKGKKKQGESPGGGKLGRSEGDGSITKLVVKLESDRKMIQVGLPKAPAVERKYLGLTLAELCARDGRLVPIVVSDLVKWMWQGGSKEAGMFVVDAEPERVQAFIHRMEKGLYSSIYEETEVSTSLVTSVIKQVPLLVLDVLS